MNKYRWLTLLVLFSILLTACGAFVEFKTYPDNIPAVAGVKVVDESGKARIDRNYSYGDVYLNDEKICIDFEEQNESLRYTFYDSSFYKWVFNTETRQYCLENDSDPNSQPPLPEELGQGK